MKKVLHWLDENLEEFLLVVFLIAMTLIMGIQVLSRYVLGQSLSWSEEITRYLFIWSGFLSVSYCSKKCLSIKIEQFVAIFPRRGKALFKVVNHTFELIFFLYMIPFAASTAFSRVLTLMQVPQTVSTFILEHFHSPVSILLVLNCFLLIVGMVMDTTPAILILTPILLPIIEAIGMDPIQFGVIMIVNLAIGFVTPPIGVNLFVASSLTDVPVMDIAKKAMPMICFFLIALLLITFIPAISLVLL